jgi:excisionase family DNA binding protein
MPINPEEILDRTETCQKLGISRQTLLSWIRKGKLRVWKRVGTGSNSALLFDRTDIEALAKPTLPEAGSNGNGNGNGHTTEQTAA